jgi:DNA-binding response OmpR family regulator
MRDLEGASLDRQHILVVCASEAALCGLTSLVASAGYPVTGSPDVWKARKLADSHRFALAILDLPPSDEAGRDLVRLLRHREGSIKLLALANPDQIRSAPPQEVDHIIARPVLCRDLLKAIDQLIGPPFSPERGGGRPNAA